MDQQLTSGITGAAPIWHNIMRSLLQNQVDLAFQKPNGVIESTIEGRKDLSINGQSPKSITGYKKATKKDEAGGEKEVITYSDPFSTFNPDQFKTTQ